MTNLALRVMANEQERLRAKLHHLAPLIKISPARVRAIRKAQGTNLEIAALFGISRQHVRNIRLGTTRKEVL